MGRPGTTNNRKPTKLRVIEGNRGKRPLPAAEPRPHPAMPERPADLDPSARKMWEKLAPRLWRMGLLTEVDGDMLGLLCRIRSRLVFLGTQLRIKTPLYRNLPPEKLLLARISEESADLKAHPYAVMERQYMQLFRLYAAEFGLSPRGRVGLSVSSDEGEPGEDLLT